MTKEMLGLLAIVCCTYTLTYCFFRSFKDPFYETKGTFWSFMFMSEKQIWEERNTHHD